MVFAYHSWEFAGGPRPGPLAVVSTFPAGVDLFMVLSGFCLYYPLAAGGRRLVEFRLGNYAYRRVRRIVPPYYAAIAYGIALPALLVAVFRAVGVGANARSLPTRVDLLSHLSFTHTLSIGTWDGINGSFWSLGLEAQFYLLFPLLVWGARRHALKTMLAALGLCLAYRVTVDVLVGHDRFPDDWLWTITGIGRWMQFVAGMAAATLVRRPRMRLPRGGVLALLVVALYTLGVAGPGVVLHLPLRDALLALAFATLLVTACRPGQVHDFFSSGPAVSLGVMSYSVFLIHQPTIYYFQQGLLKVLGISSPLVTLALLWTVGLALVLLVARLFFLLFERPFLKARGSRPVEHAAP